jgi:hypothetical protein
MLTVEHTTPKTSNVASEFLIVTIPCPSLAAT